MLKKEVLRKKEDFTALYKKGRSVPEKYVVFFFRKNGLSYNRTSFVASKKVGNSVKRNRARRLMRESFRISCVNIKKGYDILFIARNSINGCKFDDVNRSVVNAVKRSGLLIR